jgi:SOS-response transcriptional repressor LexA
MPIKPLLTARQYAILSEIAKDARPGPTYKELAKAVGLKSTGALSYQIRRLVGLGAIKYAPNKARALTLTTWGRSLVEKENRHAQKNIPRDRDKGTRSGPDQKRPAYGGE